MSIIYIIYLLGYSHGHSQVKVVHDTTQIVDTVRYVDTVYQPSKPDTVIINGISYKTAYSVYKMSRGGFAKVWYIYQKGLFRWTVKEPAPIVVTHTLTREVHIPVLSFKGCVISGFIGAIAGASLMYYLER